jgi:hypothetical protein
MGEVIRNAFFGAGAWAISPRESGKMRSQDDVHNSEVLNGVMGAGTAWGWRQCWQLVGFKILTMGVDLTVFPRRAHSEEWIAALQRSFAQ